MVKDLPEERRDRAFGSTARGRSCTATTFNSTCSASRSASASASGPLADSSTPAFRRRVERGRSVLIAAFEAFVRGSTPRHQRATVDAELTARMLAAMWWEAGRIALPEPDSFSPQRIHDYVQNFIAALPGVGDPTRS